MARFRVLNLFAVPAAGAFTSDPVVIGEAGDLTAVFDFDYGSGGTSLRLWLQTSFDGGTNWYDIISPSQFTTADDVQIFSVSAAGDLTTAPTEGSKALAAGTVQSGMIGDKVRVAGTVVGTYADSTITVIVEARQDAGGGGTEDRIATITLAVTTTGADGSATGTATSAAVEGFLLDAFIDWDATAPATSDLLILYGTPANGQILSISNSVTDTFKMPRFQLSDYAGAAIVGAYDLFPLNGTIEAQVAQCNALAPAVTVRLRYWKVA